MNARSRDSKPTSRLQRAGLTALACLSAIGLIALLVADQRAQGAFVAVSSLLPSALILVGAPRRGRPAWGSLLAALLLGALLLVTGLLLATGSRSLALLFVGLGLAPMTLTLVLFTLRFAREQAPDEAELESLRRLGERQ